MMIDYHIHTPFCNHATGSMDQFVKIAIEKGLTEICFLDHLILADGIEVPSMCLKEVELYYLSISELKRRYRDRIIIKSGLEIDFFEDKIEIIEEITGRYNFDLIGGAVHFVNIDGKLLNIASKRALKSMENIPHHIILSKYIEKLERMIDHNLFNMVCHIDLIHRFRKSEGTSDFENLLHMISRKGLVVEINTGGFGHINKVQYPSLEIIDMCYRLGIKVTIGSDAHNPVEVGSNYGKVLDILKKIGYNEIQTFSGGVASGIKI